MALLLLALGAVGHVVLWVALVNRLHALGIHRGWVNLLTVLCGVMLAAAPIAVVAAFATQIAPRPTFATTFFASAAWGYITLCAIVCVASVVERWQWYRHPERAVGLFANHTSRIRLAEKPERLTARGIPTWLSWLPGNELLTICVQEKELAIPRLSRPHAELRITHLTDLHMSGRLTRAYFERVVEEVNRAAPDIVAITGDIVECDKCLDWIPATLGRLQARGGVFYVLGNHDRHVDEAQLKATLAEAGMIHLGGTWRQVTVGEMSVILAGNELPWYKPAADMSNCPAHDSTGAPLRILLSHSPDQFEWAQANDVDLILAGHLHGGQVRLPLLGAITAPSLHGVRYASGVFRAGNTVMHVSRGTGSLTPLRYNCPPEIAVLKLNSARLGE